MVWQPNPQQLPEWEDKGYFVLRAVVNPEEAAEMRGVIKNIILTPEPEQRVEADPMDPMGSMDLMGPMDPMVPHGPFRAISVFYYHTV